MIYSDRTIGHAKQMAAELNMFWQLSGAVSDIRRKDQRSRCHDEIDELREELDILSDMSDWITLKVAIRALLAELDSMSKALEAVA